MLKKNMNKALALFVSLLMLCTMLPLSAMFSAGAEDAVNLIVNGDFETGDLSGWEHYQNTAVSADAAKDGAYGVNLLGNGSWGGLMYQIFDTVAGNTYKVSFQYKTVKNTFVLQIQSGEVGGTRLHQQLMAGTDGEWKEYIYEFVATADKSVINFAGNGGESANPEKEENSYVDNISVVEQSTEIGDESIVKNGDFETGDSANWTVYQSTKVSADAAYSGSYGVHMVGNGSWGGLMYQIVDTVPDTTYVLSFRYQNNQNAFVLQLQNDAVGGTRLYQTLVTAEAEGWNEFTYEFVAASSKTVLNFAGNGGASADPAKAEDIYLDDIALTVKAAGEEPEDRPILENGDFETGDNTAWNLWQATAITADAKHEGAYGAQLKGDGGWGGMLDQTVNLKEGKNYVLSFWYKANANGVNWKLEKDGSNNYAFGWVNATEWTQVTAEFTAETTSAKLNFCGAGDGIAEDVYVDDVSVIELVTASDDGFIQNGDFETGNVAPWTVYSSTAVSADAAYKSGFGLKMEGNGDWGGLAYQDYTVEVGKTYVIKMMLKAVKNGVNIQIQNGGANVGGGWFNSTSWTEKVFEYTATATDSRINICGSGTGNADCVYVDSVSVSVKGEEPVVPEGLQNGDFETGDADGWNIHQTTAVVGDAAHGGSYGAHLKGIGGWGGMLDQTIPTEFAKTYTLSFWIKVLSSGVNVQILNEDNAGEKLAAEWIDTAKAADWKQMTFEFTAVGDKTFINFCGGNTGVAESIYVDDVVLTEKVEEPDIPTGLQNGDFETGDSTGWNIHQTTAITGDAAHGGSYGAHLKGIGGWGGMLNQTIPTEFAKTYTLSFWIKVLSSGVNVQILNEDNAGEKLAAEWIDTAKAADWKQMTFEFTAVGDKTFINFCGGNTGVAESIYVDDVVLTEKVEEPDIPTGLENGDFETGDNTGWSIHQSTAITGGAAHGGSYGAHLKGNGGWGGMLTQTIGVKAGQSYILSFWIKVNANGANFMVKADDDSGEVLISGWFDTAAASDWVQKTFEFTATTNVAFINICGAGNNTAEDLYVDDFTLSEKSATPTQLVNGDFEDGTNGWSIGGNTALFTEGYSGSSSLLLSHGSAWGEAAYQVIALEKNTDYTLTWYSKRVSGEGTYMVSIMNEANFDQKVTTVEGQNWFNQTSSEWTKSEYVFNTGEFSEIRLKFCPETAGAGSFLVDAITLTKAGEAPADPTGNLIKNGNFESGTNDWKWATKTKLDTDNAYTGKASARLDHDSAYGEALTQMVTIKPNTDYVIIYYTKRISGHGAWDLFLMDGDTIHSASPYNVEFTSGQRWFQQGVDDGWVKTRLEFNSGEMTKVFVKFGPEAADSGVFLLDDVGMYVKGSEPAEPAVPVVPVSGLSLTSYGVLNNRPISDDKNMLKNGSFESTGGQWDVATFHTKNVSVVADSTTKFGNQSLFFDTSSIAEKNTVTTVFWMDVEEDTSYVFSTWLKGAFLADDNRGRATIGVVDENRKYLTMGEEVFLNGKRQLVPTAWDNQWHLRSVEFNTGSHTKIGIAMTGWGSKLWIDDMALFEVGNGIKYMSENMAGNIQLDYNFEHIICADEDNLIPDSSFNNSQETNFWQGSYGWRNNFVTFANNEDEYGTSMKYISTGDKAATHIIKWVDVEPNTQYTFAVDLKIIEDGFGKIVLLDNKKRDKVAFYAVSFDSYDYDDYENTGWRTVVTSFNTDAYDKIGIAFVDDGGEALIDNMYFFKTEDGIAMPDNPNSNFDDVRSNGWIWIIVGSAVALVGAAITIILLINKRKKKGQPVAE